MGASALPIILFTLIWGAVAASGYWVPQGPHKQLIQVGLESVLLTRDSFIFFFQVCLVMTGACCWLFWLCCYMSQMNPLIGPIVTSNTAAAIHYFWGNFTPGVES